MTEFFNSKIKFGFAISFLAALFFGVYPPAAKVVYADGANQTLVILATTFGRTLCLLTYALFQNYSLKKIYSNSKQAITSGFFQAISIFGIIASLQYIPGPVMITIVFTHTIMLLFIMWYKKEIVITKFLLIITLSALFGITLVVNVYSKLANLNFIGITLASIAAIATATRLYSFGNQIKNTPNSIVGAQVFSYASLFVLLLVFWKSPVLPNTPYGFFWLIICMLSLGIGSVLTFYAISLIGSFQFSLFLKLEPIFTCIYSYLIIGEVLSFSQYLGVGIVLLSLGIYQIYQKK